MRKPTLLFVTCQRSILLSFEVCCCFPFSIGFTLHSCTFQKVPNTQMFHFQTQDSDFCLTNNHGSIKGSVILRDITITTPCRDLVDTKTANLNTKDFQQGGCRLLNHTVCFFWSGSATFTVCSPCSLNCLVVVVIFSYFPCSWNEGSQGFWGWFFLKKIETHLSIISKCVFRDMATLQSSHFCVVFHIYS